MDSLTVDALTVDVLVVGGGTGGSAAAIQAARQGAKNGLSVLIVSELPWLGGMLSAAGVSAPDGNELQAFQTGIWGDFLKELRRRHPEGLNHGWVSFFTYNPAVGAQIFSDWASELPNLQWIAGKKPQSVLREGDRITGVQFEQLTVHATITLDATELGDVIALGNVPHRWGWETKSEWNEPSAPASLSDPSDPLYQITQQYPVQSPTWVVVMQDYGEHDAPKVPLPDSFSSDSELEALFSGAWANYGDAETSAGAMCLNYGRLPNDLYMINWPHKGNDYGSDLHRLIESDEARHQYGQEAQAHSQAFARYIQLNLGAQYGLARDVFPATAHSPGGGFALMPYYRESRRLVGVTTISEGDILPRENDARIAALPINAAGEMQAIAFGNYANDHHYPGFEMPLAPKSIRWGGRWTGTAFTIPYEALIPKTVDGLLACEKNISTSHIANGATRLQPVVLGIGQAAGMAAALCVEKRCEPRELSVRSLQKALIADPTAPAAVVPLYNLPPQHSQWHAVQSFYIDEFNNYSSTGYHPLESLQNSAQSHTVNQTSTISIQGELRKTTNNQYKLSQTTHKNLPHCITLVTIACEITDTFLSLSNRQQVQVVGTWNAAGKWLLCTQITSL